MRDHIWDVIYATEFLRCVHQEGKSFPEAQDAAEAVANRESLARRMRDAEVYQRVAEAYRQTLEQLGEEDKV